MTPQSTYRLISGDCLDRLREMPECSIDAVVTDPPAGIGFMGKGWDKDKGGAFQWIGWLCEVMQEVRRVLKPGGHALVWALPRTSHWTGIAVELAGFEVRDVVQHIFGSGFPKSLDVGKAIDKAAGVEREVAGRSSRCIGPSQLGKNGIGTFKEVNWREGNVVTAPATEAAKKWDGWGTALKPSTEFWWLCRKPLGGTVAGNVMEHGTGALNVDGCRVGVGAGDKKSEGGRVGPTAGSSGDVYGKGCGGGGNENSLGRFPPHLLLSHAPGCTCLFTADDAPANGEEWECVEGCAVLELDKQGDGIVHASGHRLEQRSDKWNIEGYQGNCYGKDNGKRSGVGRYGDNPTASRFFPVFRYSSKPSRAERDAGIPRTSGARNHHPTVKSLDLMRWLCRLVTPEGGTVLDPFMGSGSTGCAALMEEFSFIGIEQEPEYLALARDRIRHWAPMWATDVSEWIEVQP